MTLLLTLCVVSFGIDRFHKMVKHVNSDVSTEIKINYFNDTSQFNSTQDALQLQFAFGVSSWKRSLEDDDDNPDYGSVSI